MEKNLINQIPLLKAGKKFKSCRFVLYSIEKGIQGEEEIARFKRYGDLFFFWESALSGLSNFKFIARFV